MEVRVGVLDGDAEIKNTLIKNHFGTETISPNPILSVAIENSMSAAKSLIQQSMNDLVKKQGPEGRKVKMNSVELGSALGQEILKNAKQYVSSLGSIPTGDGGSIPANKITESLDFEVKE